MIKGLTYVAVMTDDVPRARRFFTEQLGLGTEDDIGDAFSQFTTGPSCRRPDGVGTLWAILSRPENTAPHSTKLYLEVDDADAAYRLWRERGVEMVDQPHDEPFGRTFAFKDPDGRVLHAWARA